ncbi:hypothetical protein QH639_18235 [Lysinibacillus sp. 1 U-2021]|uniref:hypothetical protein n=1 Tax=Lysinibacillus sp. 1 U-2021 TaxID=3039426 RepID=UPI002481238E|nr:hypothetical protein [Lysinibacillus sp. 1 U-2021]WGT37759.1 hypothetical protein QH639_18235 [Lysinibacillus sp. 1 U-2021]
MIEPPLESNQVQLTLQHRISFDRYNKTLSFKYQKRGGKGKNAPLIEEYAYGNEKHFGNFKTLTHRLLDEEFREGLTAEDISNVDKFITALDKACDHIDKVANEMYEYIIDKIVIDLGESTSGRGRKKIKGIEIYEDEVNDGDAD